jgi:HSP20 family protein
LNVYDDGEKFVVLAELPGFTEDNVDIQLVRRTLTVVGKRENLGPEGYTAHRQERPEWSISRSVVLPSQVDAEKVSATLKNGLLRIELVKHPQERPRTISVQSA